MPQLKRARIKLPETPQKRPLYPPRCCRTISRVVNNDLKGVPTSNCITFLTVAIGQTNVLIKEPNNAPDTKSRVNCQRDEEAFLPNEAGDSRERNSGGCSGSNSFAGDLKLKKRAFAGQLRAAIDVNEYNCTQIYKNTHKTHLKHR